MPKSCGIFTLRVQCWPLCLAESRGPQVQRFLTLTAMLGLLLASGVRAEEMAQREIDRSVDVRELGKWIYLDRSLTTERRLQAFQRVIALLRNPTGLTDVEFYLKTAELTALADNGHSNTSIFSVFTEFGLVPLRTYWFSDGLYIVRAEKEYRHLLGARIVMVEGKPLEEITTALKRYHGGIRALFQQYVAQAMLLSPAILHAAGLAASARELSLLVEYRRGGREELRLPTQRGGEGAARVRPWRYLVAEPVPGEEGDWTSLFTIDDSQPLYLQESDRLFRYVELDIRTAYVQFRANIGDGLEAFLKETRTALHRLAPRSIIFDNRQNGGGDLTLTADFALGLPSLLADGGRVYSLTGPATFSAGIYSAFFPRAAAPASTRMMGERVGDRDRFWAETFVPLELPQSKFLLGYSLQLHDPAAGCHNPEICHLGGPTMPVDRWNIAVGPLDPQVVVPTTFADYIDRRDPLMARIRSGPGSVDSTAGSSRAPIHSE